MEESLGVEAGGEQRGETPWNISKHFQAVALWDNKLGLTEMSGKLVLMGNSPCKPPKIRTG